MEIFISIRKGLNERYAREKVRGKPLANMMWDLLAIVNDGMMVELKENELRSIPEESLSIGGADFGGPAMLAVGPRICDSGILHSPR